MPSPCPGLAAVGPGAGVPRVSLSYLVLPGGLAGRGGALPGLFPECQPQPRVSKVPGVPLPARRAGGVGGIGHEACRQWFWPGYSLTPQGPLGIHLLGWESAQHLKVLVGLQTCVDRADLSHSRQGGILGCGRARVGGQVAYQCSGVCRARAGHGRAQKVARAC